MAQTHERQPMPEDRLARSHHLREPAHLPTRWKCDLTFVATVSILGAYRDPAPLTRDREPLLQRIVEALLYYGNGWELDAILLPGGFFQIARAIGTLETPQRIAAIHQTRAGKAASAASLEVHRRWYRTTLVLGFDSAAMADWRGGDQLVTAWQEGELVGLARKAFPVSSETTGLRPVVWVKTSDFNDPLRMVLLRNANRIILCACYDAFAIRALGGAQYADLRALRLILDEQGRFRRPSLAERQAYLSRWLGLLKEHPPDLAFTAIHEFARPGRDCYWQRHGLAGASAALAGKPILGAAHFREWLPSGERDCPLASQSVPLGHLGEGHHRTAHRLSPDDGIHLIDADGTAFALIRFFTLNSNHNAEGRSP